jgi:hypothetical protein
MTHDQFCKLLDRYGYTHTRDGDHVDVIFDGHVYLYGPTTLPEDTTFSNSGGVDLPALTTLPDGITFSNGGYVDLPGLTTLPEDTTFSNGGAVYLLALTALPAGTTFSNGRDVYLPALTTLPEDTTFINSSYVDLGALTTLPDGITFNNGGTVYLGGLTDEYQNYRGQSIRLKNVDGYTMLILSEHAGIYRAAYFAGGDLSGLKRCYVAKIGDYYAHGDTAENAVRDATYKHKRNLDQSQLVAVIKARGTVGFDDFRLITGACESGLRHGMREAGLDPDAVELPLETVLGAVFGSFGDKFKSAFVSVTA